MLKDSLTHRSVTDNESASKQIDLVKSEVSALRNQVNRHSKHTPYCLRRDQKSGQYGPTTYAYRTLLIRTAYYLSVSPT